MLIGVDEAGRGPLAGPVVAAAVAWVTEPKIVLKDSKLLTAKSRKKIFEYLTKEVRWAVASASAYEIDKLNIRNASLLAMERAIAALAIANAKIIIDGLDVPFAYKNRATAMVKADQYIPQVSAASIIAKVFRDELMVTWSEKYTGYGLELHKGYPTALHKRLLVELSAIHRRTFCKWIT